MPFSKKLSVGNRILDSEHKKLFNTINEITHLIIAKDISTLVAAFELLENSLCAYFVAEENIARTIGFDFTQHRLAHQHLLDEFKLIQNELTNQNGTWSKHNEKGYIASLRDCLIQHIQEDAKPLRIILDTHLYDLKPGCLEAAYS
ncbi:MAG: hypothetical protein PHP70_11900 [Gallionella sp.]|nr:hypothetical protein [Gallionella sp.]